MTKAKKRMAAIKARMGQQYCLHPASTFVPSHLAGSGVLHKFMAQRMAARVDVTAVPVAETVERFVLNADTNVVTRLPVRKKVAT